MVRLGPLGHRTKSSVRVVGAWVFCKLCQVEQFKGGGGAEQMRGIIVQLLMRILENINKELV